MHQQSSTVARLSGEESIFEKQSRSHQLHSGHCRQYLALQAGNAQEHLQTAEILFEK
jgi:hypothetical protein